MAYWDTSALIKLYAAETDSPQFKAHASNAGGPLATADITRLELLVALRRKEAEGFLAIGHAKINLSRFDQHVDEGGIRVVALISSVVEEFVRLTHKCYSQNPPLFVRTLDMIHLASAQASGVREFVCTDKRLREAAKRSGFDLFPPAESSLPTSN